MPMLLILLANLALLSPIDGPVAFATFNAQSPPLTEDGDNEPTLRAWLDSLPAGTIVQLPAGDFPLHRTLVVTKKVSLLGQGRSHTTLRGVWDGTRGAVLQVGDYNAGVKVNAVQIDGLQIMQTATGAGIHNCIEVMGDDFRATSCDFSGAHHEGVVVHGVCFRASILDCDAIGCGLGNESYTLSTAGFNSHAHPTLYTNCQTRNCGQGFEIDGHGSRLKRCKVSEPGNAQPSIAYNVGSTGLGISDVEIDSCVSIGCPSAFGCGNGIGRLADVNVHDCIFDGGAVSVMGGIPENTNTGANIAPGPDTGLSHVDRCVFIVRGPHSGILGYNSGINAGDGDTFGREPFTFNDNDVYVVAADAGTSPIISGAGKWVAPIQFKRNRIWRMDAAPDRGDLQLFTLLGNHATPGQANVTTEGNLAFKLDGSARTFIERREGTAP
jgi:hypothetical protein